MAPRKSRTRFGALVVLATCFIVSALIRVGEIVAALPASAADDAGYVNEPPGHESTTADDPIGPVRAPKEVIAELRRQREMLDARAAELDEREQQLQVIRTRLADRLDELKAERKRLAETASLVNDAAGKDVRRLASMYEQMKPKQAAQIFDRMEPSFAAGFLSEMRPASAALIMANMEAERAYGVSLLMAGRNIEARRDGAGGSGAPDSTHADGTHAEASAPEGAAAGSADGKATDAEADRAGRAHGAPAAGDGAAAEPEH